MQVLAFPPIDAEKLIARDEALDAGKAAPLQFAEPIDLAIGPGTDGTWSGLPDGSRAWRLRIQVPGATDLNFGFTRFAPPEGATLTITGDARGERRGPYAAAQATDGQLWTPVVAGDSALVELVVPPGTLAAPDVELGRIGAGYRDFAALLREGALPKSGACNNDVVCPVGDPWRDEINSAIVYGFGATLLCSGTMVMDVPRDFVPYVLTANHCGLDAGNDASVVTYFNYQTTTCGGARDGQLNQSVSGSTFRAAWPPSDFALIELSAMPSVAFNAYWAGWDRSDVIPQASVAIHHPNTDEKAITFDNDPMTKGDSCIGSGGVDSHWYIGAYEDGTTEPGSSGSGIWDANTHFLVGTLSGGGASCTNLTYDCWGRFARHWTGGGTSSSRLSDWLDPSGTGPASVPGGYPAASIRLSGVMTADSCSLGGGDANGIIEPGETVQLQVELIASGAFTNVRGMLRALTPGVTLTDPAATWPNLASGVATVSDPPHLTITVDDTVACYATLDFELDASATEGGPYTLPFQLQVGRPLVSDAPVPITDLSTSTSTTIVADARTVSGLKVYVNASHSYIGDLTLRLRSPAGTTVTLFDRPGEPATLTGCPDNDVDATFDDAGAVDPETVCTGGTPWLSGTARPTTPLAAFDGEPVTGTWSLVAIDAEAGDEGTINDWRLILTPPLTGRCDTCGIAPCRGQEISTNLVRVRKGPAGSIVLTHGAALSSCALGEQVRMSSTARPATDPGSWPSDPAFADVTSQDLDPAAQSFRHVPPAGSCYYLVVETLPGGAPGPSGSY